MKKTLLFIIPTMLFICCQPKTVEVEVNASAGEQFLNNFKGKKYIFGSDEDAYNAVSLVLAYAEKDSETMAKFMRDTVVYYLPAIVKSLHEPYDSIQRRINNVVPLKIEGSDYTRVSVAFREKRYYKDGTQESVRLIDRIFFREGKIFRIIQWMGEIDN